MSRANGPGCEESLISSPTAIYQILYMKKIHTKYNIYNMINKYKYTPEI